jgi:hypothetical protein
VTTTSTSRTIIAPPVIALDPVFAAIERHQKAEATYVAARNAADPELSVEREGDVSHELLAELLAMTPTTVAGCAAMLRHVTEYLAAYERAPFEEWCSDLEEPGSTLLTRIAATLERSA